MRFRIIRTIRIIMVIGIIRTVTINRITQIIHIILRKNLSYFDTASAGTFSVSLGIISPVSSAKRITHTLIHINTHMQKDTHPSPLGFQIPPLSPGEHSASHPTHKQTHKQTHTHTQIHTPANRQRGTHRTHSPIICHGRPIWREPPPVWGQMLR